MRIEELIPGMTITFLVDINGKQLDFDSKIIDVFPKKHLVLADVVYRREKVVSFQGDNIIVDVVVNTGEDKPQIFRNVIVKTLRKSTGELCYNLICDTESKTFNRRESYRCYVGLPTNVQIGMGRLPLPAILRDVSINGFSIVCDRELGVGLNHVIHVELKDQIDERNEKFDFQLYGLISRVHKLKNGKILYGCRLNSSIPKLESYIMKKERIRLRNNSGGNL